MTESKNKEVKKFIENTNSIIEKLTNWQIEQRKGNKINQLEISNEWIKFSGLCRKAKNNEILKEEIIQNQYRTIIRNFKFFQEDIKIFKSLPDY